MFTIFKSYINPKRSISKKKRPTVYVTPTGQRIPLTPFKPSYINVKYFAEHRDCSKMIKEHYWLSDVRMYENPELTDELVKADFETLTIQLSTEVLQQNVSLQRDIFIRTICSFIAQKLFYEVEQGKHYHLLVQRYSVKTPHISTTNKDAIRN